MTRLLNERVVVLLALFLIAAGLYATTFTQSFSDVGNAHSPVFFPRIILVCWMVLAVIALGQAVIAGHETKPVEGVWRLLVIVVASVLYTNLITTYGFFLTSAVFTLVSLPVFGIRHPLVLAICAMAMPGALVLLFNHVLGMPLPTSPFSHLF